MKIKQNKVLSLFLALLMLVSVMPMGAVTAFAETDGNFEYYVISEEEKTCAITHYDGSAYELTIPSQLNGYTVTKIGDFTFSDSTSLERVIIPDSVTHIGSGAFEGCKELTRVIIPESVTSIWDYAFADCPLLTVYGYSDSYARTFAEIHNIPFIAVILRHSKSQIRFHGIGSDKVTSKYAHKFDIRTVAKITENDFLDTFTSEENAKDKISDFGFVYAAKSKVADFDVDTAKIVAEGGEAENYVKKSVTYMQHTGDGEDYIFTCIISDIDDNEENKADCVNCLAYVCFDGKYYYFATAATVSFNELYTANMPS